MILEPLNIIVHPTEELQTNILKISFGQHLRLCCMAVGMPPPNYIWYHGDAQLQDCTSNQLDIIITRCELHKNVHYNIFYKCSLVSS